jgi:EmrB/QacA subfamily drug resistance transporter
MSTSTQPSPTKAGHGVVTAVVCLALATVVSAVASLNVALPDIARSTHASLTQLEWVVDAYSLVFACLLLPAGALGDRYGRRATLLIGLLIFGAASGTAMTAGSANTLIVVRGVMGLGAALVMPATLSTITSTFPSAERTRAVGMWAGVAGASAVLGLLTSGVLLEFWSWRSVFGLNVVLAVAAIAGTLRFVPESADSDAPRLDITGAAIAVVGLVALVYSIVEAPDRGWLSMRTLGGIGAGLVVLAAFIVWELKRVHPMLDPRIFHHPRLAAGTISIFVQFLAFFGFIFIALQYLQIVRSDSPLVAALSIVPLAGSLMPMARLAPNLAERYGTRTVCVSGLVMIGGALVLLAQLTTTSPYLLMAFGLVVLGAGMGAAMTPATSAITAALPSSQQGVASAMNDLSRELGGAIGIAVMGSILATTYRNHLHLGSVPAPLAEKARQSVALASHIGGPVAARADVAFVAGLHAALLCGAVAAVLAAIGVAILLAPSREPERAAASQDRYLDSDEVGTVAIGGTVVLFGHFRRGSHINGTEPR